MLSIQKNKEISFKKVSDELLKSKDVRQCFNNVSNVDQSSNDGNSFESIVATSMEYQ